MGEGSRLLEERTTGKWAVNEQIKLNQAGQKQLGAQATIDLKVAYVAKGSARPAPQQIEENAKGSLNVMIVKVNGLVPVEKQGSEKGLRAMVMLKVDGNEVGRTKIDSKKQIFNHQIITSIAVGKGGKVPTVIAEVYDVDNIYDDDKDDYRNNEYLLAKANLNVTDCFRMPQFFAINKYFDLADDANAKKPGRVYLKAAYIPEGQDVELPYPLDIEPQ
eukprot:TRINITY_DN2664_c0_g1_i4.p1 TRINITY_DN2664_c0_g1~~TRINITY_DN2664_c0_g1_i4.p1  ORF type:complete len:218 (+),score=70.69 TRINITY_DN2664_c0_g1_i4:97-750(+)